MLVATIDYEKNFHEMIPLIIDIIDYVTGIGNSSREQFSYVVTAVVLSVSPSNSPKSATADAIAHAKL